MGYDKNFDVREFAIEHSINAAILDRNCTILPEDHKINDLFDTFNDDIRFHPTMTWIEFKDWDGLLRRVEGHVCKVEDTTSCNKEIKIFTAKHEMVMITLSAGLPAQFGKVQE